MKTKLYLVGLATAAIATAASAVPVDVPGTITFTGAIVATSCKVNGGSGATNISVDMGTVATDDVGPASNPTILPGGLGRKTFDIVCKAGPTKVSMKFAGTAAELKQGSTVLRVNNGNTSAGYAQGVGIAVYPGTGGGTAYNLASGELVHEAAVDATSGATIPVTFTAVYVQEPAGATPTGGQANASLPFTLTYE